MGQLLFISTSKVDLKTGLVPTAHTNSGTLQHCCVKSSWRADTDVDIVRGPTPKHVKSNCSWNSTRFRKLIDGERDWVVFWSHPWWIRLEWVTITFLFRRITFIFWRSLELPWRWFSNSLANIYCFPATLKFSFEISAFGKFSALLSFTWSA